ncbi:MAG: hypothetical protein V3U63_11410 [Gemmatimonadota bacterium]
MALAPTTIDRLVFIRQLYLKGVDEANQSFPLSATAILTFHDAIEIFFVLAADEKSANVKTNTPLMQYFEAINQAIGSQPLYHKPSVARLNEARRGLKHQGILLAPEEINRLRYSVTEFFEDNTPLIFGVPFASVSLVDLVENERAKELLKESEEHMAAGDARNAIVAVARASHALWKSFKPRSLTDYRSAFGSTSRHTSDGGSGQLLQALYEIVVGLDSSVELLMLGIEPRRAGKFKKKVPGIAASPFEDDSNQATWSATLEPSLDDYRWCFDFVVDVAIRMQRVSVST